MFALQKSKSVQELRPCVSVAVSEFGIISQNYTDFREIKKPNISVQFSYRPSLSTGVPFRKFSDFFEYFESPEPLSNGQKHKKPFILVPERARAILSVFSDHLAIYTRGTTNLKLKEEHDGRCVYDGRHKRRPSYTFYQNTYIPKTHSKPS